VIVVDNLTKRFGNFTAVDHLSFTVKPGRVTGFLGPNGSGKSTTMRCMIGLDHVDGGSTTFGGQRYEDFRKPLRSVGVLLDAGNAHIGRNARNHLLWLARSNGIDKSRVEEVLEMVGLTDVARRRVGKFSLGMKQRLGLAAVLLGDPQTVILDEPANGLDPEGIRWIREVLKNLASEGRAVLVSSHLLGEISLIADDLIVIGRGRLIDQCLVTEFIDRYAKRWVSVASPQLIQLVELLERAGARVDQTGDRVKVTGIDAATIGELAAGNSIVLHQLATETGSLEDAFLELTADEVEYHGVVESAG
jgi:ABC-2 type transport system ATP-binding protein